MQKIFILPLILSVNSAFGAFDFENYTPTLDYLYANGQSSIPSGYEMNFQQTSSPGNITTYMETNDGIVDQNWNYSVSSVGANITPIMGKMIGYVRNTTDKTTQVSTWENKIYMDFISNKITSHEINSSVDGGALHNTSLIRELYGDFINNGIMTASNYAMGGAIYSARGSNGDRGEIEHISGNFIGNYISGSKSGYGGAIYNGTNDKTYEIQTSINANFIANYINATWDARGGALYVNGVPGKINADFISNSVNADQAATGGAIYIVQDANDEQYKLSDITGNFIDNHAVSKSHASGGAMFYSILPGTSTVLSNIQADFINNYAVGESQAMGGAIYTLGQIDRISGNFINNYANSANGDACGGAIYSENNISFRVDNNNYKFSGNHIIDKNGVNYNAIYMGGTNGKALNFDLQNMGSYTFNDNIDGANPYDINISGDGTGALYINNFVINAGNININNAVMKFDNGIYGKGQFLSNDKYPIMTLNNATFDMANTYIESVRLGALITQSNSYIHLNVNPADMTADILNIDGDVTGQTKLVVHALDDTDIRGKQDIVFATATGQGNDNSFSVFRVFGSPYMYDVNFYDGSAKTWALEMNNIKNPDYDGDFNDNNDNNDDNNDIEPDLPHIVRSYPEIVAYAAMQSAMLDQTHNSMNRAFYVPKNSNIWITPVFAQIKNDTIAEMDSKVFGGDFGYNKSLGNNWTMGVMGSIREAKHSFSGKAKEIHADLESWIDGHSQIFGGYMRYNPKNFNVFAGVYGGLLQSEVKTDDGFMTDFSGTQTGIMLKTQYLIDVGTGFKFAPVAGITYINLSLDSLTDVYGRTVEYDNINQILADFGITFSQSLGAIDLFIRPSYLITSTKGNNVNISDIGDIKSVEDFNVAQLECGLSVTLGRAFDGYLSAKYGTASDYSNMELNIGVNYKF
ncbi:MAG: autotransporter domain-containing protein [Alphaproteobacteria bacterium]|nr:autotransporter domain-containing protein [Alphaproteobacteria bacterium]